MFKPSAAPRWKITTRRLLRVPGSAAPMAARARKVGTAAVPTTARALLRRKTRRVMDIKRTPSSQQLSPLKLRRTQQQPRNRAYIRSARRSVRLARSGPVIRLGLRSVFSSFDLSHDRVVRLLRHTTGDQASFQRGERLTRIQ